METFSFERDYVHSPEEFIVNVPTEKTTKFIGRLMRPLGQMKDNIAKKVEGRKQIGPSDVQEWLLSEDMVNNFHSFMPVEQVALIFQGMSDDFQLTDVEGIQISWGDLKRKQKTNRKQYEGLQLLEQYAADLRQRLASQDQQVKNSASHELTEVLLNVIRCERLNNKDHIAAHGPTVSKTKDSPVNSEGYKMYEDQYSRLIDYQERERQLSEYYNFLIQKARPAAREIAS